MSLEIKAERSEYKGYPMLKLTSGNNEKFPFSFGLQKAKRILACIKDIEEFVAAAEAEAAAKVAATPAVTSQAEAPTPTTGDGNATTVPVR